MLVSTSLVYIGLQLLKLLFVLILSTIFYCFLLAVFNVVAEDIFKFWVRRYIYSLVVPGWLLLIAIIVTVFIIGVVVGEI